MRPLYSTTSVFKQKVSGEVMKKQTGIYGIKCNANEKIYIGHSGAGIKKRWSAHKSNLRHSKHNNKSMQNDWNQYGEDNFEFIVLEECLQRDLLINEKKWEDIYGDKVYNVNNIKSEKKKIRRGREAKIFKEKWSKQNTGERNPHCTKFTVPMIIEIKRLIADNIDLAEIAQRYGTTENYINQIKYGKKWASVTIEKSVIM